MLAADLQAVTRAGAVRGADAERELGALNSRLAALSEAERGAAAASSRLQQSLLEREVALADLRDGHSAAHKDRASEPLTSHHREVALA